MIEELLSGPEIALLALVDGERAVALPVAQDHKRLCEGNRDPNTSGMGAYAPYPGWTRRSTSGLWTERSARSWPRWQPGEPHIEVCFRRPHADPRRPARPRIQLPPGEPGNPVLLPLLDEDLFPWLEAVADGELPGSRAENLPQITVAVVLAAPGCPRTPSPEPPSKASTTPPLKTRSHSTPAHPNGFP